MFLRNLVSTVLVATSLVCSATAAAIKPSLTTPSIVITSAYLRTKNVTVDARANLISNGEITINFPGLLDELGGNPFPGYAAEQIAFLFTLSNDTSTYYQWSWIWQPQSAATYYESIIIGASGWYVSWRDESGNTQSLSYPLYPAAVVSKPAKSPLTILGVNFGPQAPVTNATVFNNLYDYAISGDNFTIGETLFSDDRYHPIQRAGVIWYEKNGMIGAVAGQQGSVQHF